MLLPGAWASRAGSRFQRHAEWRSTPTNERRNADRHQRLANAAVAVAAIEGAFARGEHSIGIADSFCIQSVCHRRLVHFGYTVRRGQDHQRPDRGNQEIDGRLIPALRIDAEEDAVSVRGKGR